MLFREGIFEVDFLVEDDALVCRRKDSCERIVPWGGGIGAWRRIGRVPWQSFVPALRLSLIEQMAAESLDAPRLWPRRRQRIEACRFLVSHWPANVRDAVRGFSSDHWLLLYLLGRGGEPALALLQSNPALGFALATSGLDAVELLAHRRRRIASACGFPESEHFVRLLGKVPAPWVSRELLEEFREQRQDGDVDRVLSHLNRINPAVLHIASHAELRTRVSHAFLARAGRLAPGTQFDLVARLESVLETANQRNLPVPGITQPADIDNALRATPPAPARRPPRQRRPARTLKDLAFPEPPFADTADRIAIRTIEELRAEGAQMHHCAGTEAKYARRVAGGKLYFYRVLRPERLTLAIGRAGDHWEISEAKCQANREPQAATLDAIRLWLRGR
jgi:hypothetical protein